MNMTAQNSIRIPGDLKAAGEKTAAELGLSFAEVVRASLQAFTAADHSVVLSRYEARIEDLERELRLLRGAAPAQGAVAVVVEGLAGKLRHTDPASAAHLRAEAVLLRHADSVRAADEEAAFAAVLQAATQARPVTPARLARETGWQDRRIARRLLALVTGGYIGHEDRVGYWPLPGVDVAEAMKAVQGRVYALERQASQARRDAGGSSPVPAPRDAAGDATGPQEARDAAAATGAPAPDVRPATAVFQEPGEGKIVTFQAPVPAKSRKHSVSCKCGVCKPAKAPKAAKR